MEMDPEKTLYPDANSTMRLSYGTLKTTILKMELHINILRLSRVLLININQVIMSLTFQKRLIELNARKEFGKYGSAKGYMPVCFLTTNDITGGNSGSPVLNGNGELIGLAFDGNWEAMSGDIAFEPELQRTIVVDIRYVLWVMDVFAGAKHLVDEMNIVH